MSPEINHKFLWGGDLEINWNKLEGHGKASAAYAYTNKSNGAVTMKTRRQYWRLRTYGGVCFNLHSLYVFVFHLHCGHENSGTNIEGSERMAEIRSIHIHCIHLGFICDSWKIASASGLMFNLLKTQFLIGVS